MVILVDVFETVVEETVVLVAVTLVDVTVVEETVVLVAVAVVEVTASVVEEIVNCSACSCN